MNLCGTLTHIQLQYIFNNKKIKNYNNNKTYFTSNIRFSFLHGENELGMNNQTPFNHNLCKMDKLQLNWMEADWGN